MKIKISAGEKLVAALAEVQGKAKERTLYAADITLACEAAEKKLLDRGVCKKDLPGCRVIYGCNRDFSRRYKWTPAATYAVIERWAGGWYVVDIFRGSALIHGREVGIKLTDTQKEQIAAAAIKAVSAIRCM